MKVVTVNCPNCGSKIEVNKELESGYCNYCGNQFVLEDENETKEERIIKTIAKVNEKSKESDRKYYASDDYKKKVDLEKETKIERFFRKMDEQSEKNREYYNTPEGKKEYKMYFVMMFLLMLFIFLIYIVINVFDSSNNDRSYKLDCSLDGKQYLLIIKENELINCASCSDDMLDELNNKYLVNDDISSTYKNVKNYFINNNGTCK